MARCGHAVDGETKYRSGQTLLFFRVLVLRITL